MSKKQLVIQHDLSKLDAPTLAQYLRDVSEFIGLDPDLNALDTIWMQNENGPGQSLVVYARRGTAEILRNKLGIQVTSLTSAVTQGSIVFTAAGNIDFHDETKRHEIAVGSKYITGLTGKALDDAIMTASTRALRRLTMQFTTLGLLDESEVKSTVGDTVNLAAAVTLAGSAMVIPPQPATVNNAPGKDVTGIVAVGGGSTGVSTGGVGITTILKPTMQEMRDEATAFLAAKPAAKQPDINPAISPEQPVSTSVESTTSSETEPDKQVDKPSAETSAKPKRARKAKNSVSLETSGPEPEIVTKPDLPSPGALSLAPINPNTFAPVVAAPINTQSLTMTAPLPATAPVAPASVADFAGKPSAEQMADYRKKVSVFTSQLPSSENLGSVQKMRAFITKMSGHTPQFMTTEQWEETLAWFEFFVGRNQIKGLVTYINDTLGVK